MSMKDKNKLPQYNNETLAAFTPDELIACMIHDEDRVPRNVIDECARRGEEILHLIEDFIQHKGQQEQDTSGHWWLQLHIVMILGLIPGERAGRLLADYARILHHETNGDIQDWLAGYWPVFFQNKPVSVINRLRDICTNKKLGWYVRSNITDAVIAYAQKQGQTKLEETLDWAAQFAADETEDWDYRLSVAGTLLDFPRERYRSLLDKLADTQSGFGVHFTKNNINQAYAENENVPEWHRFNNPWEFYELQEIAQRQQRWQEEDQTENIDMENFFNNNFHDPYQRDTPKIGRNSPCPCGSGKKYKKCCLSKAQ